MKLQIRDREILKLCHEQQFITIDSAEQLFRNFSHKSAVRRLNILSKKGLIAKFESQLVSYGRFYRATKLGKLIALESGARIIKESPKLLKYTLQHDSIVTSVRIRLESIWKGEFIPESILRSRHDAELPDGLFVFESGKAIAIEVENSEKGRNRFVTLANRWKGRPEIAFVLYIATSEALYKTISERLKNVDESKPMGVVLWGDLKSARPCVATVKGLIPLFDRESY